MSDLLRWFTARPTHPLQYLFYGALYLAAPVVALSFLFWLDQPYQLDSDYEVSPVEFVVSFDGEPPETGWQTMSSTNQPAPAADDPFTSVWFRWENPLSSQLAAFYVPVPRSNLDVWYGGKRLLLTGEMTLPLPFLRSPVIVPLPPATAQESADVIVRVARYRPSAYAPSSYIAPHADAERDYKNQYFIMVLLPIGVMAIMSLFVIFMTALYLLGDRESAYGWFALTLYLWGLHTAHALVDAIPFYHYLWFALNYLTLLWINTDLVFVNRFFSLSAPRLERFAWIASTVLGIILLASSFSPETGAYDLATLIFNVWMFACALLVNRQYFRAIRKAWTYESVSLWLLSAAFIGVGVRDLLFEFAPQLPDPGTTYYLQYTGLLTLLVFGWHLVRRFVTATKTAQLRNRELDEIVDERTQALEQSYKDIAIEEKKRLLAEERARLMRDMHDGLGGQLVHALALSEQGGDSDLQNALRLALDDLRLIVDSLSPEQSGLDSLLASYRHRVSRLFARTDTQVSWELEEFDEQLPLTPKQGLNVLRILQEAVTNAVRHANCKTIRILLSRGRDTVRLQVIDDGIGMQTSPRGRGLKNMHVRAQEIGADLRIESSASGSTVSFDIPMPVGAG